MSSDFNQAYELELKVVLIYICQITLIHKAHLKTKVVLCHEKLQMGDKWKETQHKSRLVAFSPQNSFNTSPFVTCLYTQSHI